MAADHLFERASVFQGHELLAESLNQSLGAQTLEDHKEELRKSELVTLVDNEQNPLLSAEYATREGLYQEVWCRDLINRTKGKFVPLIENFEQRSAETNELPLRPDQKEAARLICTSTDQVSAVRGLAGAEKTYMLSARYTTQFDLALWIIFIGFSGRKAGPLFAFASDVLPHEACNHAVASAAKQVKSASRAVASLTCSAAPAGGSVSVSFPRTALPSEGGKHKQNRRIERRNKWKILKQ